LIYYDIYEVYIKNVGEMKMMRVEVLSSPSKGTVSILMRKIHDNNIREMLQNGEVKAIGLVQGNAAEIIMAADVAEKASNVEVSEVIGNCPQHIIMIGIFGDLDAVKESLNAIQLWKKDENKGHI